MGNEEMRPPLRKSDAPDPAKYNVKDGFSKSRSPAFGMGTQPRDRSQEKAGPGPGNYEAKTAFSNKGVTMGQLLNDPVRKQLEAVPGPGSHNPQMYQNAPKFSMHRKLEPAKDRNPGPGQYEDTVKRVKNNAPSFGFGSSKRPDPVREKEITPGPG